MERELQRYFRYHRAAGHSPKTAQFHSDIIGLFISWLRRRGYSTAIDDLDVDVVRDWAEDLQDRDKSDQTITGLGATVKGSSSGPDGSCSDVRSGAKGR